MPRQPRRRSETGIYHVMLKGIDDRNLFLDEGDKKNFLSHVVQAREKGGFSLLAFCLMGNHVHLLLEEGEELGVSMKRITVGYVFWHNQQYKRSGHLFQNRYRSEVVETDDYLVTVARYIHQNPVKAGLVKKAGNYHWSSFQQYIDAYSGKATYINPQRIKAYFKTSAEFEDFMSRQDEDKCLGYESVEKVTDDQLFEMIRETFQVELGQKLAKEERKQLIKNLYQTKRTNIRQLARVLGVSKGVIERALHNQDRGKDRHVSNEDRGKRPLVSGQGETSPCL